MPRPLPPTELYAAERAVVLVSCLLSCLGSCLLLCTHALWPELRTRPRQLLLYLSLADLLSALSYFYGVLQDFDRTSWDCVLQGALSTFSNTSSFFWTMAIALYLYLTIVRGSPTGAGLLCCFHAVRWVLPDAPVRRGAHGCPVCSTLRSRHPLAPWGCRALLEFLLTRGFSALGLTSPACFPPLLHPWEEVETWTS